MVKYMEQGFFFSFQLTTNYKRICTGNMTDVSLPDNNSFHCKKWLCKKKYIPFSFLLTNNHKGTSIQNLQHMRAYMCEQVVRGIPTFMRRDKRESGSCRASCRQHVCRLMTATSSRSAPLMLLWCGAAAERGMGWRAGLTAPPVIWNTFVI